MPRKKQIGDRGRFEFKLVKNCARDEVVGAWIDAQPNASEAIKALIYMAATGQNAIAAPVIEVTQPTPDDPVVAALLSMET